MGSSSPFVILTLLWLFRSFDPALARLSNTTFDDTGSGITYSPASLWNDGTDCNGCTAHPDTTKMNGGTWHDSTHQPGGGQDALAFASFEFTGSAVYVFCAIAHSSVSPDGNSDMSFFLDGKQVGSFVLPPTGQAVYDYNVPVFVDESISPGSHTLSIQNGSPGGAKSLILLDYIVVTTVEADPLPPPPPSSSPPPPQSQPPTSPATQAPPTTATTPSAAPVQQSTAHILPPSSVLTPSRASSSSVSSTVVTPIGTVATTVINLPPTSTEAPQDAAGLTQSSPNTSPSTSGSVAAANASPTSHKTRTTIIAAVVPSVIVLLAIAGVVFFCMRRRRHEYHLPPDPEISKDPEASGWAPDAWGSRGAAASSSEFISSPSNFTPSNFTPSNFTPVSAALLTGIGGTGRTSSVSASGGVSTIPSPSETRRPAVRMTMSSISSASAYSASDENHAAGPSASALSSVTEEPRSATSSQPHPYAVRTPIATTPEPDFTPQSTSNVPVVVAPPPPPLTKAEEAGFTLAYDDPAPAPMPPSGARPLPAQPTTSMQARATQVRRTFASTSSDVPPSYEDISRDGPVRL